MAVWVTIEEQEEEDVEIASCANGERKGRGRAIMTMIIIIIGHFPISSPGRKMTIIPLVATQSHNTIIRALIVLI